MTLELPDSPVVNQLTPASIQIELACALYASGKVGRLEAWRLSGTDFLSFQQALFDHGIPACDEDAVLRDLASIPPTSLP